MKTGIVSSLGYGNYSRKESNQGRKLYYEIRYLAKSFWYLESASTYINVPLFSACTNSYTNVIQDGALQYKQLIRGRTNNSQ